MQKLLLNFVNSIFQKKNTVKSLKNLLFFKNWKLTIKKIELLVESNSSISASSGPNFKEGLSTRMAKIQQNIEFLKHKTNFERVTSGAAQSCNDLGGARSEKTARFSSLKGGKSQSDMRLAPPAGQPLPCAPPNSLKVCAHSRATY